MDNPEVAQLQQQLRAAMLQLQQMQQQLKEKTSAQAVALEKTRETNQTKERIAQLQEENENKRALARHFTQIMGPQSGSGAAAPAAGGAAPSAAPAAAQPKPMSEFDVLKAEAMRIDNAIKRRQLEEQEAKLAALTEELAANQSTKVASGEIVQVVDTLREKVSEIDQTVARVEQTMETKIADINKAVQGVGAAMADVSSTLRENADRAIAAINRPKRIVREKGRIAKIEVE